MDLWVAWGVVVVAGLGALAGVFMLTRSIAHPSVRWFLRCLVAVWLLLPWSTQVVPGQLAPAFVVAIFEGFFREDGHARPPLVALALVSTAVLLVFLVHALVIRRGRRAVAPPGDAPT